MVIDMMELKRMMEKLGQPKTHLELKKMIAEVDTNNSGTYMCSHMHICAVYYIPSRMHVYSLTVLEHFLKAGLLVSLTAPIKNYQ